MPLLSQARFDPPYVYNVQDHRPEDVQTAIEQLLKNPLEESFIPDDMKKEAYLNRSVFLPTILLSIRTIMAYPCF